jgi:hypothetical protein
MPYWNPTKPIDPFYHLVIDCSKIRSIISILPWLKRSQHHQCIIVQREFIRKPIGEYYESKEVGYTLAVRPNYVYYEVLSGILSEEEVIHKVTVAQRSNSSFLFYTRKLPNGPFEETTNWRDNILEEGCPPTPGDSP